MKSYLGKFLNPFIFIFITTFISAICLYSQDSSATGPDHAGPAEMEVTAGPDSTGMDTVEGAGTMDTAVREATAAPGETHQAAGEAEGEMYDHRTELAIGERLFFGLTGSDNPVNCAACHNLREMDTLNWNPSALDIALSTKDMDSATYANILLNPVGKRLSIAHEGIDLAPEQIALIREYLTEVEHTGLQPKKRDIHRFLLFIFLVLLVFFTVADLIWFRAIRFKVITVVLLLLSFGWGTKMVVQEAIAIGRSKNYAPLQPIKFSHVVHAGEDQIDCQYCHSTAEYSKSAGIPSANVCLNCHTLIRDATRSGHFEINKIHAAVDNGTPIEWIRVHRLPDFVFFSHAQHVGVAGLDCAECHGPVEEMDVLTQYNDLSMGWCLRCHRSHKVNFNESEYYKTTFKEFHRQLDQHLVDSILVEDIGGTDCQKCHY